MGANNSRLFVLLLSVAAAVGIGNIWLYPYYSFSYTGLFFIPYLIALVVLGIPLLLLEFSMGQYFNKNVVDLFASVKKWFSGIGWLMLFNAFIVMSVSAVILSWHIIYFFVSFGLQWETNATSYFFKNVFEIMIYVYPLFFKLDSRAVPAFVPFDCAAKFAMACFGCF